MKHPAAILKRYFVSGVLVVVPLILTYIVLRFLFHSIDGILQPLLIRVLGYSVPGLGVFTTILLILLAGVLTRNYVGAKVYQLGEKVLIRLPLIRPIYSAAKQLLESLTIPSMRSFKEVVLIEYPRRGTWALGFVANRVSIEIDDTVCHSVSVFVPSTPTPLSGMVVMLPEDEVFGADMTVEEGIKFLVSGGVVSPPLIRQRANLSPEEQKEELRETRKSLDGSSH